MTAAFLGLLLAVGAAFVFSGAAEGGSTTPEARGALDCNGWSKIQQTIKPTGACTDIRGFAGVENANNDDGRFYDNGHYIGHDEPDLTFLSSKAGSGNNVTWKETLGRDPSGRPTADSPGNDTTHFFDLTVAPWFSMALCNPRSYPLNPCTPNSDSNAPKGQFTGGGSSFLEVQFYPPGEAPFYDNVSCDNRHWCASLHINDLECTYGFDSCNGNCEEPTNFAFIQKNGIPTGPPSPQQATLSTYTPDSSTLLMNPGDKLKVHIWDAPASGGGHALEVRIDDLTTGQSGWMQASAANGYEATGIADCTGRPFNYEPEYNTAQKQNVVPWAALQTDISTEYEIGHATPCKNLSNPATGALLDFTSGDPFWLTCNGPYESSSDSGSSNPEGFGGDAFCYPRGDTHSTLNQYGITADPNMQTFCLDELNGGDLDFDGTSYWADWPTSTSATAKNPGSFAQSAPISNGNRYPKSFFQTDVGLSESTCSQASSGCTVPPNGPGHFYPYWSTQGGGSNCKILFGNVANGHEVNNYGKFAQYGKDLAPELGYDEFEGPVGPAVC